MTSIDRRTLLRGAGAAVVGSAFLAAAAPFAKWRPEESLEDFLRAHYKEMTPEDLAAICRRVEEETRNQYGVDVQVGAAQPQAGVAFGYALNLSICIGCRLCAEACHQENNHDRPSNNSYIRVLELDQGSIDLATANVTYDHPVPADGKFYMPVQCHQCRNAPCTKVCPCEATWQEDDGLVVIDYDWCIGCRYCEVACPYQARRFNWGEPEIPADEINPEQGYLSNRMRSAGVMEKCTFCLHRVREGRLPACLESCPTGARVFGDLADAESDIRWILENKRVFILKEDLQTRPRFFYFFDT